MSFNKLPHIQISDNSNDVIQGWSAIAKEINNSENRVIVFECYQGIFQEEIDDWAKNEIEHEHFISTEQLFKSERDIEEMTFPDVTDDRIFGYLSRLNMIDYFDQTKLENCIEEVSKMNGRVVIVGKGASLLARDEDLMVYLDMARWEIQQRMRSDKVDNLGVKNRNEKTESQYKRAYFVDWRVCDRLKKKTFNNWDFYLDSNQQGQPKMINAELYKKALLGAVEQPFSLVPFFDPGPWGGQWMKEVCELDKNMENFAWCFNCVPEENSMLFKFGEVVLESPSVNLVFFHPEQLLGDSVHARFGDEFPIRFDFLDTMEGGNLSLQVHPTTEYIQEKFGMHYTQDESYYMMDAGPGAKVYLGLKNGIDEKKMISELEKASKEGSTFDADRFVETWDVKKHDHFLIPGGTIHCSGADSMVLEISSTPYIFTFKLWDWGRMGMDGRPRPINLEHGKNVINWERTKDWTAVNLVNRIESLDEGDGWREERTGLHEREFIETRRFWFSKTTHHDTKGTVHVLNLVEGKEAQVESPDNRFDAFKVNYAETFIVPAAVGRYTIKPIGESHGKEIAVIKAYVR